MTTEQPINILIVDDNAQYREAFKRTLLLEDYAVCEAADADEAINVMNSESPDVVVTDLQMRTEREGLELIELIKAVDPLIPVIMISGVGSFEEGALATKLGAAHVIHKSRIEDEIDGFFETIRALHEACGTNRGLLAWIAAARELGDVQENADRIETIRGMLADPELDPYVKSEASDFIASISERELRRESEANVQQAAAQHPELTDKVLARLKSGVPIFDALSEDTRKALSTAEYLYDVQDSSGTLDFARTIAFSYCFAVESEVRARLKGKVTRLASNGANQRIFEACMDRRGKGWRVAMEFQQQLFLATRNRGIQFTIGNVKDVLLGLIRRKDKFRPDGLKDVGILILGFGRAYTLHAWGQTIKVDNPLKIKGLQVEDEIIRLAGLLINLQYARNPYVHADVKKKDKLTNLRGLAFDCLNTLGRVV